MYFNERNNISFVQVIITHILVTLLNDSTPRALAASFKEKLTSCAVLSSDVRLL